MTTYKSIKYNISGADLTGLTAGQIPNLSTDKLTSGTLPDARIADLAATKLTGTIDNARISLDAAEIPSLNTSKLTAGTLATARLGSGTASSSTFLRGDNTWVTPTDTNTTYSIQDGELSQNNFTNSDHSKLDGIASSANNYTHPNHSGEVTSSADGATVIADNVVDEANLKVSNGPTNGQVLTARSGNTGGMTWEAASGGVNTPFFRVSCDTDNQYIQNNVWRQINFDTEVYDVGGVYDTSNKKFTAPSTGYYFITIQIQYMHSTNSGRECIIALYKNGSLMMSESPTAGWFRDGYNETWGQGRQVQSHLISLSENDYLQVYVKQNHGNNSVSIDAHKGQSFWQGFKLIS